MHHGDVDLASEFGFAAAGELSPGQGAQIITALAALARVSELDEIESRLSALEKGHQ